MSETLGEKPLEATMISPRSFDPGKASLVELLRYLADHFQGEAEQTGYGFFCGGDPRRFTPDPECSTEQERAKWKADCEAWERGEQVDTSGNVGRWTDRNTHIQPKGYGLGTYTYEDSFFAGLAKALKRHQQAEPRFTLAEIGAAVVAEVAEINRDVIGREEISAVPVAESILTRLQESRR